MGQIILQFYLMNYHNISQQSKILMAHSNKGSHRLDWHNRRKQSAYDLGYNMSLFSLTDFHDYTIFPYLDRKWKQRDKKLMKLYEKLGQEIEKCDIFIHYNGALIHPYFLEQFKKIKIYHCADDPDASNVISKPVANFYDICAISNPSCIDMYKSWGCKNVFFWPIGAYHFRDEMLNEITLQNSFSKRNIDLIFIGSKYGVPSLRYIGKYLGLYKKKSFMNNIHKQFPTMNGYGSFWGTDYITDDEIPIVYNKSKIGLNLHNSLGPVNSRLYDLSAFGICQVCDNKSFLNQVFELDTEIIGFDNINECIEKISYYINHPIEAELIGINAKKRFIKDYTIKNIWINFFNNVNKVKI
jgi:spore maturation protein CgeB